ncbi:MAG: nucleoside 2-deoxyribosyltransferase domain-containing protein [Chloroflexota bacterium]
MAQTIKPPSPIIIPAEKKSVFLAGSIEMGKAEDWQTRFADALSDDDVIILNPRRDDWDSSWEQRIENDQFRGQVEWELAGQEQANVIALYFAPDTKAPITLLELGLFAHTGKVIVCCPDGFWRKGNVDVVCRRYGVKQVDSLQALIAETKRAIFR